MEAGSRAGNRDPSTQIGLPCEAHGRQTEESEYGRGKSQQRTISMLRHAANRPKSKQGSLLQSNKGSNGKGFSTVGLYQLKRSAVSILTLSICVWGMRSLSLFSRPAHGKSVPPLAVEDPSALRARAESALWSFFAGDALSSPTHWFYGGSRQVQQYYGAKGITGYTKPSYELQGSILNKSNLSGGGRSGSKSNQQTIIGNVINHGKANLWSAGKSIHYHATLASGEPTLEAQIGRVLMRSIAENGGQFNADHFRQAYIDFMTTPGTHNDTYASTCHRMFFANYHYKKLDPKDCPDNDKHNVDTIDGRQPTVAQSRLAHASSLFRSCAPNDHCARCCCTRRHLSLIHI